MTEKQIDNLTLQDWICAGGCHFDISKIYKHKNKVNGVQIRYDWNNSYGHFHEFKYLSRADLLDDYYEILKDKEII